TRMNFPVLSIGYTLHGVIIIACLVMMFRWAIGAPPAAKDVVKLWLQELHSYGRPFLFLGIGGWLLLNVDRWIVDLFFDRARVGLFNYAANLGGIIPTLTATAMMQAFFPGIFHRSDVAKSAEDWRQIARRCDKLTMAFTIVSLAGLRTLHFAAP